MTTDVEVQELLAELAAYRQRDNVIHPKVEPNYYVGQWITCADGDRHRVMGRAIDWDKNVTYTLGLPNEDAAWVAHHEGVAEAEVAPVLHRFQLGAAVRHANGSYVVGAQHFDSSGNPFYELRDPESNGGHFAKHANERELTSVE